VHSHGGGGTCGGFYLHPKRRLRALVDEWVDVSLREMYEETLAVPAARADAGKIVKPHADTKKKVPPASLVDWDAIAADAERTRQLIALWSREVERKRSDEIEREDEMVLFGIKH
jgi:hypothetical protein